MSGNVWQKNKIPPLEYCKLSRAADLLDYKIEDLVHFAEIGTIELSLRLSRLEAFLISPLAWRVNPSVWEKIFPSTLYPFARNTHKSALSLFTPKTESSFADGKTNYLYHHKNTPALKSPLLLLDGMWSLVIQNTDLSFFADLSNGLEVSLTALDFCLKECDIPFNASTDELVMIVSPTTEHLYTNGLLNRPLNINVATLGINDFYLTRAQVEKLYNGIDDELPNYINGGATKPNDIIKEHGNVESSAAKREAVYKAAIYWLLKDPDSCKGKRGSMTIDAWAEKIITERNDPKAKVELGIDKVKECLRAAKLGKN